MLKMPFTKNIAGWGNYPRVTSRIYNLHDKNDFLQIIANEKSLISRGLGRSYGDQAINQDGAVVLSKGLNKFISFDTESGILTCEAGVSLSDIILTFAPKGWFPYICPGTKFVTIGGAIANDIHGKAHHVDGSFANCVKEFSILLADGSIERANREHNSNLFWSNFGGLGLLGIILTATIQLRKIETTFFKQKAIKTRSLDELLDAFDQFDSQFAYSVAWIDSLASGKNLGKSVLTIGNSASKNDLTKSLLKTPLKISGPSKIAIPFYLPPYTLNHYSVQLLNQVINTVQSNANQLAHYDKFFFPLDSIHHWNKGYGKKGFIQYQFVIPLENGRKNIHSILKKVVESGQSPFLNVLKKFGKGQTLSPLSFPMEGYTFAIDFPIRDGLFTFIRTLDKMVIDFGGRVYLGKDASLDQEMFQQMYPTYFEWVSIKRRYDPTNHFSSNLSRRLGL